MQLWKGECTVHNGAWWSPVLTHCAERWWWPVGSTVTQWHGSGVENCSLATQLLSSHEQYPAWMIHVMCHNIIPHTHTHIYTHTHALKRTTILLAPTVISSSSVSYICTKRVSRYMVLFLFNTYYIVVNEVLYFLVSLHSNTTMILFYIDLSYMKLPSDKSRYYRLYCLQRKART